MKAFLVILVVAIIGALIIPFLRFTPLEPPIKLSPTPTEVVKKSPCDAITVKSPLPNQKIAPPTLSVTVIVNNTNPVCHWTVFEGQAGTLELQDENQNTLGTGTLTTTEDWTAQKPVTYQGSVPVNSIGNEATLIITEENPNGQDNAQTLSIPLSF